MIFFLNIFLFFVYIVSHLYKPGREHHRKLAFFSGLQGLMLPVDSRENKFLFLAKKSTKLLYFLREGGEERYKGPDVCVYLSLNFPYFLTL